MVEFLIFTAVWFGLGIYTAPRFSAHTYRVCGWSSEINKRESATEAWWCGLFGGPIFLVWMPIRNAVHGVKGNVRTGAVERALIKHDPGFRDDYLRAQKQRIARLTAENERLTNQIIND